MVEQLVIYVQILKDVCNVKTPQLVSIAITDIISITELAIYAMLLLITVWPALPQWCVQHAKEILICQVDHVHKFKD